MFINTECGARINASIVAKNAAFFFAFFETIKKS